MEHFKTNSISIPLFGAPLALSDTKITSQIVEKHAANKNVTNRKECLVKTFSVASFVKEVAKHFGKDTCQLPLF